MQLVEQTIINEHDPRYAAIDAAAFAAKNLYNLALYEWRQAFIHQNIYLSYAEVYHRVKDSDAYQALPRKVSNDILRQLDKIWRSFRNGLEEWYEHPEKFTGRPRVPKYKHKTKGRFMLIYDEQAISKRALKRGMLAPSGLGIEVPTRQKTVKHARIVPRMGFYVVEVVYEQAVKPVEVNPTYYMGIDIGMNVLAALTSNKPKFQSVIINGRPLKSINQYYNKRHAQLQKKLGGPGITKRMQRLINKRNRRIDHYMHTASRYIIDLLVKEGIGTLVIGKNDLWKQEANMGKRNNQNFVQIPHARFVSMLTYKAELVGITVKVTEESYTSKASFLDLDPLPVHKNGGDATHTFSGRRVKRGLYRASNGRDIHADCNGSANIIRKVAPDAFGAKGVEDFAVHPVRITLRNKQKVARRVALP
ncbi:MAG TPA: transposase [Ktedonosporobacter sp.]|jgi:putative transposase|nr:transposase [Ktedonosporobacter sp.]